MGAGTDAPGRIDRDAAGRARANAMTIDFSTFKSQVLAYLPPEDQASYDSASVWDAMVLEVVEALEKVRP
jgi:hypothetical protein